MPVLRNPEMKSLDDDGAIFDLPADKDAEKHAVAWARAYVEKRRLAGATEPGRVPVKHRHKDEVRWFSLSDSKGNDLSNICALWLGPWRLATAEEEKAELAKIARHQTAKARKHLYVRQVAAEKLAGDADFGARVAALEGNTPDTAGDMPPDPKDAEIAELKAKLAEAQADKDHKAQAEADAKQKAEDEAKAKAQAEKEQAEREAKAAEKEQADDAGDNDEGDDEPTLDELKAYKIGELRKYAAELGLEGLEKAKKPAILKAIEELDADEDEGEDEADPE